MLQSALTSIETENNIKHSHTRSGHLEDQNEPNQTKTFRTKAVREKEEDEKNFKWEYLIETKLWMMDG